MNTQKKLYFWATLLPSLVVLLTSLAILILFRFLPSRLPLFYSLPWGDNQLADHFQFLIIPASASIVTLLNLVISTHLHEQQIFFKRILIFSTILSTAILTISFIKIILIFI